MDLQLMDNVHEVEKVVVRHGLPALDSRMTNQFGIEWVVRGYVNGPGLDALARGWREGDPRSVRDEVPVIVPQNLSQRLLNFLSETDYCTSKTLVCLDTMPHLRPWAAHTHGQSVNSMASTHAIYFQFDAAHLHETVFAHEVAHIWIELVEECEDYRMLADLSDPGRITQFNNIQSFVLDRRVNEVIAERGFDMSVIQSDQLLILHKMARATLMGVRPRYAREAATDAIFIADILLDRDFTPSETHGHSEILCYDGSIDKSLEIIREAQPDVYHLADRLANSVRRHGHRDRDSIRRAVDECLTFSFEFTGDPLDLDTGVVDVTPRECYQDKWPEHRPGLPVPVKLEINRTLAKRKLPLDTKLRTDITPSGRVLVDFWDEARGWTGFTELKSATGHLERMPRQRNSFPEPVPAHFAPPLTGPRSPNSHFEPNFPASLNPAPPFGPPAPVQPPGWTPYGPAHVSQPMNGNPHWPQPPGNPRIPDSFAALNQVLEYPLIDPSQQPPDFPVPGMRPHRPRRYYLPGLGRWMSRDPLGLESDDTNLYRYVRNNPLGAVDPTGLAKCDNTRQRRSVRISTRIFVFQ